MPLGKSPIMGAHVNSSPVSISGENTVQSQVGAGAASCVG